MYKTIDDYFIDLQTPKKPFSHQIETVKFLIDQQKCLCLNGIGSGKTLSVYWALDYLIKTGQVKKTLVLTTLSTIIDTHFQTLLENFPNLFAVYSFGKKEDKLKMLSRSANIYILNHDSARTVFDELMQMDLDCIIVDEVSLFKNRTSLRTKCLRKLARKKTCKYFWGLTGTPCANNNPMSAWTLKDIFGDPAVNFVKFRYDTMIAISKRNSWIKFYKPKQNIEKDIIYIMQPAIRTNVPEEFYIQEFPPELRYCPLPEELKTEYSDILKLMQQNKDKSELLSALFVKLRMLLCGYSKEKETISFNSKLEECLNVVEESENKVIIFCPFIEPLKELQKNISKQWDSTIIYGDTKAEERAQIFNDFQNSDKYKVLLAHPNCMAHGITLTRSNIVIYFAPPNGAEIYIQSKGRVKRLGQKFPVKIIQLYSSIIEKTMYKKLDNNEDFQDDILQIIANRENL